MRPICVRNGYGLWYSPDDGGYYWQDRAGAGDWTSATYPTLGDALKAMRDGMINHVPAASKGGAA